MTPPAAPPRPIATPCIKVCAIDPASGLCFGCLRSLDEIAAWARLDDAERARILADLKNRRTSLSTNPFTG
jgi:predicted Fe-S protein YdhL (DUF1289 family)